jgi:hypothetical protein
MGPPLLLRRHCSAHNVTFDFCDDICITNGEKEANDS